MISATTEFSRSGGSPGRGEKPAYTVPANLTVALPEPPLHRCAGSVHKKNTQCVSMCTCRYGFSRPVTGFTMTVEDYCLLSDESTRYASGSALNNRNLGFKNRGGYRHPSYSSCKLLLARPLTRSRFSAGIC